MTMKYLPAVMFSLCFIASAPAFSKSQQFETLASAQENCPAVDSIQFEAGEPAPGPLAAVSFLTGTFSAKKNDKSFTNSLSDFSCPAGTAKPHAITSAKDVEDARKSGDNVCLVIIAPIISSAKQVEHVEFFQGKNGYGSVDGHSTICNYKYIGKVDPETSKPLESLLVLRSH